MRKARVVKGRGVNDVEARALELRRSERDGEVLSACRVSVLD